MLVLLFPVYGASAQTGKISGRVTTAESEEGLPGVNVVIVGTQKGSQTDGEGYYTILNVDPGSQDVRASFIGFVAETKTGVNVDIDLTSTVNFALQEETIGLEEVVVEATDPVIQKGIAGSQQNIDAEDIDTAPYQNINNVINAQVGVNSTDFYDDNPETRGSPIDQSKFIVDGIEQGDPLTNRPYNQVNLAAVKEVKIETGGFSAEYGNARSSVTNVVLKDGGEQYSGAVRFQYKPPGLKHFGPMMFGFESPVVRPFVSEEAGAFTGNEAFAGWNAVANERINPGDAHYGAPMELYARYLWRHRSKDAINELKRLQREGIVDLEFASGNPDEYVYHQYGTRPDYNTNLVLSGPVPLIEPLSFLVSYDQTQREYATRFARPTYNDQQVRGKLTANLGAGTRLRFHGFYSSSKGGSGGQGPGIGGWVSSDPYRVLGGTNKLWYPNCAVPGQQIRQNYGLTFEHSIGSNTILDMQFVHGRTDYKMLPDPRDTAPVTGSDGSKLPTSAQSAGVIEGRIGTEQYADSLAQAGADGWDNWRDWARLKINDQWYDESPAGYGHVNWRDVTGYYRMESCNLRQNDTYSREYSFSAKVSSQVNRFNFVRGGVKVRNDRVHQYYSALDPSVNAGSIYESDGSRWSVALWAEDKLEYEGFVATVGLRANLVSYGKFPVLNGEGDAEDGPYSRFLLPGNTVDSTGKFTFPNDVPSEQVRRLNLAPRLGVSHPIGNIGKVFFNYGHFYQTPSAFDLYQIQRDTKSGNRIDNIGNPALKMPRTIQYELGYEQNLFNRATLGVTSYYKDRRYEIGDATYHPLGYGGGNYEKQVNISYADVRGIEARLQLRRGTVPYFSGWATFNYWVESGAEYGLEVFYEDPAQQPSLSDFETSDPDVRPIFKSNIEFSTPDNFGPGLGNSFFLLGGIDVSLLYTWRRGSEFTWNPADIPLVENNMRWNATQRWDLRFRKELFTSGRFASRFFIDVHNLLNQRNMQTGGGWTYGEHGWFDNNQFRNYMYSLGYTPENQNEGTEGTFDTDKQPGDWKGDDIDLPAFTPWTFLEPREVFFGFNVSF